ncbi:MAG: flagellar hook-basal body complex protein FliE [Candidatus Hydrogenedentes bacterium]|nr:flagellar hook-basal body complex protein FliE [Candidatus Hydrogenedentota bacterium]
MADPLKISPYDLRSPEIDARQMRAPKSATPAEGHSFRETLSEAITEVQRLNTEADATIKKLVSGDIKDVTEALVAVERADLAFQTMMTVRNRVVTAYEEILRMQV